MNDINWPKQQYAAQPGVVLFLLVLRSKANDGRVKSESGDIAEDDHGDPDEGEDTIFEAAHPAGQKDLTDIGEEGGDEPNGERNQSHACRAGLLGLAAHDQVQFLRKRPRRHTKACREEAFSRDFGRKSHRWIPSCR